MIEIENDISLIFFTTLEIERTILSTTLIFIRFSIYDINRIKTTR
jgi:hypothetical protein